MTLGSSLMHLIAMPKPSHIHLVTINIYLGLMANDIHIDVSPCLKQSGVLDKSECK